MSMRSRFILSFGIILVVTGSAKIANAFGNSSLLAVQDPIIGIRFGHLMMGVGVVEIGIALVCFWCRTQAIALNLVAWISTAFLVYRFSLWWIDWKRPCNCLGNLTDVLHISPQLADNVMKIVLAYLVLGSCCLLIHEWWPKRSAVGGIGVQ